MEKPFKPTFAYKLIYILEIRDEVHKGLLKIGDATIQTDESIDNLPPNCKVLNQAAKLRIKEYTNTVGVSSELLHTELAVRTVKDKMGKLVIEAFRDHLVHDVLENSGIEKKTFRDSTSREWFKVDIETAKKAITAVKRSQHNLSNVPSNNFIPIVFRPEQVTAIEKTIKQYKDGSRMLWNAKMRFGKTLCALEVVKRSKFEKTIIITHRPVVDNGWYDDFRKIFHGINNYVYGSKNSGYTVDQLLETDKNFVYFASMQDLRGSDTVGGKFDKNNVVYKLNWDFVIVDEAHEGTTTALGNDVIKNIIKEGNEHGTKFLALSGTPFNILGDYDDNIYTWDYVMEQSSKREWDNLHFGDSNPYDELPELNIFTYDLGKLMEDNRYIELEDKAFNFREFFRVWTGDMRYDRKLVPREVNVGEFYHAEDVWSFLNLITKEDQDSQYPYATEEYRSLFKHSLWMVPGVKEAKALSKMMKNHPVFGSGAFNIVNVAGDGDEEEKSDDALKKVRDAINNAEGDEYTITLSCGKLTTGVTVPEWTAVFMLAGSFSTSAANYLQTIFRVQSPCNKNGKIKSCCYVFDFAPDRTLKMVAESVAISTRAGKANESDKRIMGEFLNYCPVIAVEGTAMKKYDTNKLLQQLKRAYADRAVRNGFDDNNLYNDELLKLDDIDLEKFSNLKGIVGASKAAPKSNDIDINRQGFTDEEYEEIKRIDRKKKKDRTAEEEEKFNEINEKKKQAANARSILRGVSIRMPLLIYGADINLDEDITINKLVDIVDDPSWNEFMPTGVTKGIFKDFIKYYDPEIFVAAGRKIRNVVKSADELSPAERVLKIAQLFSCFKNPDKETVLTPWKVVNMHLGDCLGGYDFYDKEHNGLVEEPRYSDNGKVTNETLNHVNAKILEINSKTGLYPLYVTYSIFRSKCKTYSGDELIAELEEKLWNETVQKNVFVICNTPMAKSITKRTLVGFKQITINAHYFDDLVNTMKNKPNQFVKRVLRPSYWKVKGTENMKFDAVVGNPPYQLQGGSGGNNDAPIYQHFAKAALQLQPKYISLIIPARWFAAGRENLLGDFRREMLNNHSLSKLFVYADSHDVFPAVEIKGGICYYLIDTSYTGDCEYSIITEGETESLMRNLSEFDILIREPELAEIVKKIQTLNAGKETVDSVISNDTPFGIPSNPKSSKKNPITVYEHSGKNHDTMLYHIEKLKRKVEYVDRKHISKNSDYIDKDKVFIPGAGGSGNDPYVLGKPEYAPKNSVCSQSYLFAAFNSKIEAENFIKYLQTKFFRVLVSAIKISQSAPNRVYQFVPMQDFTNRSNVNWSATVNEINNQLYAKYILTQNEIEYIERKIKPME